jgi:hypothetical protein
MGAIAPNPDHALGSANLSSEAGFLLNLMRVLGTSLGVASAPSVLTWQLGTVAGSHTGIPVTG